MVKQARAQTRIAAFASGAGSNLQAILAHFQRLGELASASISVVVSDRESAGALQHARDHEIQTEVLADPTDGGEICRTLAAHRVDLIALAGYIRLLPAEVVAAYPKRIVNVHPAPLPRFGGQGMYGRRVHEAVLAAGVRHTGVTIHFVDEEYDRGAIIAHWPVPVLQHDTPDSLARRVLAAEHVVYPRILDMIASLADLKY